MSFIIEISTCGSVSCCTLEGTEIEGPLLADLQDCNASGDCEEACQFILDHYSPEIRIVRRTEFGYYENDFATPAEKAEVCRGIYFDSESDFDDEDLADLYLVWSAAGQLEM